MLLWQVASATAEDAVHDKLMVLPSQRGKLFALPSKGYEATKISGCQKAVCVSTEMPQSPCASEWRPTNVAARRLAQQMKDSPSDLI